jgi:hypothetical protein
MNTTLFSGVARDGRHPDAAGRSAPRFPSGKAAGVDSPRTALAAPSLFADHRDLAIHRERVGGDQP